MRAVKSLKRWCKQNFEKFLKKSIFSRKTRFLTIFLQKFFGFDPRLTTFLALDQAEILTVYSSDIDATFLKFSAF